MFTATVTTIRPELAPHLAIEASKDAAREAHWRANADVLERPAPRLVRDRIEAAEAALARQKTFAATADGQALAAIGECERMVRAIHAQLDRVRSARSRADGSLADAASEFTAMVRGLLPEALTLDMVAHAETV